MYDVVAIGESLIDFTPSGTDVNGMLLFARNPGGAPANVIAMNAKLGGKTAFIGKVGRDDFGIFLKKTMTDAGIDCSGLRYSDKTPTTLAFVQLNDRGDRSFTFVRKPGADILLEWDEIDQKLLETCHIFHLGSVSLTDEPSRTATLNAMEYAKNHGALISYDPNYRSFLWDNHDEAKAVMRRPLRSTDILKVSLEELELLTDSTDMKSSARSLVDSGIAVVIVTLGPDGAYYCTKRNQGVYEAYPVKTIDTTGAGDSFLGTLHYSLRGLSHLQLSELDHNRWSKIMKYCNAAASLTTSVQGAIPAMPTLQQIERCINGKCG